MSEPQLERSVLEAKERDELMAIATALGASPGARAKKADLIKAILTATGIEVDGSSDAPTAAADETTAPRRRTRTRRTSPADETSDQESGAPATKADDEPPAATSAPRGRAAGRSRTSGAVQLDLEAIEADKGADQVAAPVAANGSRADRAPAATVQGREPAPSHNDGGSAGTDAQLHDHGEAGHRGGQGVQGDDLHGRPGDGDPGNRRGRRRRGRDRFERAERDLPGQAPEQQYNGEPIPVDGYLDLRDEGYGFLRTSGFLSGPGDVYVSISQVRRFALRRGDRIEGAARPAGGNEKYPALLRIDKVTGLTPDEARSRPRFESLTPLFPDTKLKLELPSHPANDTARIVDLLSPIGKGQRGLIVSPPKAGKTTVLKQIAHCIEVNNPDVALMVLLVDERPEEVTDMARSVKGEVIASTFDRPAEEHIQVAELTIERAKRMVELGKDVVIILDGITRLARAYNLGAPATGRIMSGGIDTGALYPPKKFFGAARNIEEGGSLTILATALVETGSRMDEVIFEEFKGTGNMELRLDRKLAERRIYPAIDVNGSSTRHEELLFDKSQLQQVWKLRRVLNALGAEGSGSAAAGLELLLDRLKSTKNNDEFLAEVAKTATPTI
ncbi:MAG: transcription termination factor Rho [Actinomycetota bacterium]|nr:transcription termination factor Rho [Actinomycetota bacterium]